MTIDDENSVYVGGLPYDATEDTIRKAFDLYGRVVVVKIVNDRGVGGKCYGFVTFTNPRSAINAINDMNGRMIDGRAVKVSEVKTRNGRSSFGRDSFRRNPDRGLDRDRGRDRDKNHDRDRFHDRPRERSLNRTQDREKGLNNSDRTQDREKGFNHSDRTQDREKGFNHSDRSQERERAYNRNDRSQGRERGYNGNDRSQDRERGYNRNDRSQDRERGYNRNDHGQDKERGYNYTRDRDRTRDHLSNRDKDPDQHGIVKDIEQEHIPNDGLERHGDLNLDQYQDKEVEQLKNHNGSGAEEKDQISKYSNGSDANEHRSRELSPEYIDRDDYKVEEELEFSTQRLGELKNEISHLEDLFEEKRGSLMKLQEKSQSLEDALSLAKKLTSHRQTQLTKLHKGYQHLKQCSDRMKSYEEELQALVDSTTIEMEHSDDMVVRNGALPNGNA